jgi:hypothetical protein
MAENEEPPGKRIHTSPAQNDPKKYLEQVQNMK